MERCEKVNLIYKKIKLFTLKKDLHYTNFKKFKAYKTLSISMI